MFLNKLCWDGPENEMLMTSLQFVVEINGVIFKQIIQNMSSLTVNIIIMIFLHNCLV